MKKEHILIFEVTVKPALVDYPEKAITWSRRACDLVHITSDIGTNEIWSFIQLLCHKSICAELKSIGIQGHFASLTG